MFLPPFLPSWPSHFCRAATIIFWTYNGSCSSSTSVPPLASHITLIIKSKHFPVDPQAPHHLMCHRVHFNTTSSLFTLWPYWGWASWPPSQGLCCLDHSFLQIRLDDSFLQSVTASLLLLLKCQLTHHIHRELFPVPAWGCPHPHASWLSYFCCCCVIAMHSGKQTHSEGRCR